MNKPGVSKHVCWNDNFISSPWGRVTHICVGNLTIIGSDNGLSPGRRQAIISTSAGILLIRSIVTNFSEILSDIHTFSSKKTNLKISTGKLRPFCLGLNVLRRVSEGYRTHYISTDRKRSRQGTKQDREVKTWAGDIHGIYTIYLPIWCTKSIFYINNNVINILLRMP